MKEIVNGMTNEMKLEFDSRSANEAFARVTVASFMTQLNPTLEEVSDVKTAVSEAVTNAITRPELERSGMGFSFMEAFMDEVQVESEPGKGTIVRMKKIIGRGRELWTTQSL